MIDQQLRKRVLENCGKMDSGVRHDFVNLLFVIEE
jgi:hypothetical protein